MHIEVQPGCEQIIDRSTIERCAGRKAEQRRISSVLVQTNQHRPVLARKAVVKMRRGRDHAAHGQITTHFSGRKVDGDACDGRCVAVDRGHFLDTGQRHIKLNGVGHCDRQLSGLSYVARSVLGFGAQLTIAVGDGRRIPSPRCTAVWYQPQSNCRQRRIELP